MLKVSLVGLPLGRREKVNDWKGTLGDQSSLQNYVFFPISIPIKNVLKNSTSAEELFKGLFHFKNSIISKNLDLLYPIANTQCGN